MPRIVRPCNPAPGGLTTNESLERMMRVFGVSCAKRFATRRSPSPLPNDSLAPARSALGGPSPPANSFRCFPSNSSPWGEGDGLLVLRISSRCWFNSAEDFQSFHRADPHPACFFFRATRERMETSKMPVLRGTRQENGLEGIATRSVQAEEHGENAVNKNCKNCRSTASEHRRPSLAQRGHRPIED